jgi:hypothetical protein
MPANDPWDVRTPFDRMMDEIAAATSVSEVDHLWLEVRRDFAGDPRLAELEDVLAAKRRLLAAESGNGPLHSTDLA